MTTILPAPGRLELRLRSVEVRVDRGVEVRVSSVDPWPGANRRDPSVKSRYRLDLAQKHLDEIGPLDRIETFTNHAERAETNVARCEQTLEDLGPELDRRRLWDEQHGWPADRLHAVEAELAELGSPAEGLSRDGCGIRRASGEAVRRGSTGWPRWPHRRCLAETREPAWTSDFDPSSEG